MCYRMSVITRSELEEALIDLGRSGHARFTSTASQKPKDAYPGSIVPVLVPSLEGRLVVQELSWGFSAPQSQQSAAPRSNEGKLIFNTRLDTALSHTQEGRGMWKNAIQNGRCLVPVRAFWESYSKSSEVRKPKMRFTFPQYEVFLLAAVSHEGRFSVVTTEPNQSVAPFHHRMPLVLGPGESSIWLGPNFASLALRSHITLEATQEGTS